MLDKRLALLTVFATTLTTPAVCATQTPIYGAWHCGNDYCTWSTVRDMTGFDQKNHWLIDRGDSTNLPSVNPVILSFVNPLCLLNKTNEFQTSQGVPIGITQDVVDHFKNKGVRVMLSIGGITYVKDWNTALKTNPSQLGRNAAEVACRLGVDIEIDYEENKKPNLAGLQAYIHTYRSYVDPATGFGTQYDPTGLICSERNQAPHGENRRGHPQMAD